MTFKDEFEYEDEFKKNSKFGNTSTLRIQNQGS